MAYRARPVRLPTKRGSGYGHSPSRASRIAIGRITGRKKPAGGGSMAIVGLVVALGVVMVLTTSVIAGIGAGTATLEQIAAGLPDVRDFDQLQFAQPTTIYDRTGKVQLANFQQEKRTVLTYDQIPHLVLDATTATEDHTFWENPGFDINGIGAAVAACLQGDCSRGGASTITQQLVRARLLPPELLAPGADQYIRKAKEIYQSYQLNEYVKKYNTGQDPNGGKELIITAYLNQIFYGHNAYGIAAAAQAYFGKSLSQLTIAQAALLVGLPQSPTCYDLYRWLPTDSNGEAVKNAQGQLEVPLTGATPPSGCAGTNIVDRRNFILGQLFNANTANGGTSFGHWTQITQAEYDAATKEPIILVGDKPTFFVAPQFVWAMKSQLDALLVDRQPAETGGYTVITTLDMNAQKTAEKYITAATIIPHLGTAAFNRALVQNKLQKDRSWISFLRDKGIYNGAMVAMDYKTGDVLAYVGSAGYYRDDLRSKKFEPKFDVAGSGYRQPGSAFKPVMYTTAFDQRKMTPGSILLDVTTPFASNWVPKDADLLERGPVRARKALQYSLNIPAIRTMGRVGPPAVDQAAARAGLTFPEGPKALELAGLAGAIGTVEVHLIDLVATFGAFGNNGLVTAPRMILSVTDQTGASVYQAGDPQTSRVWSPQAAWLMSNILEGNTNPTQNFEWGPRFQINNGPGGTYRPAALKTGTTNDVRDMSAYGLLAKPTNPSQPAIALGVWMGNSNHTPPTAGTAAIFSADGPGMVWHSFLRDYMNGKPVSDFPRPKTGLVQESIDAFSGGKPGPWTKQTVNEWFISGTEPTSQNPVDPPGLIYTQKCGQWMVDPLKAENPGAPATWLQADRAWAARAAKGPGIGGQYGTRTAYFFGESSWGGPILSGSCTQPSPSPTATPVGQTPSPAPTVTPKPTKPPRPTPTPKATPTPKPTPTPKATPTPTPKPTKKPHKTPPPPTPSPTPTPAGLVGGLASTSTPTSTDFANDMPPIHHQPSSLLQPGILTEPVIATQVRVGRRRRRRQRPPRLTLL